MTATTSEEVQYADALRESDSECACTVSSAHSLDHVRLRRVLDYIAANIEDDVTLVDLAGIACYSQFHFARKFTLAMGISPHRYVSRIRLENAMAELVAGKLPLAEIALNAHFSSQASFTRAFHRATGTTPNEYRRRRLSMSRRASTTSSLAGARGNEHLTPGNAC
jgi:AraC family transcriptional regulator